MTFSVQKTKVLLLAVLVTGLHDDADGNGFRLGGLRRKTGHR
jgi:hypothetical protein